MVPPQSMRLGALLVVLLLVIVACGNNALIATAPEQTATPTKTPRPTSTATLPPTETPVATETPLPSNTPRPSPSTEPSPTAESSPTPEASPTVEMSPTRAPTNTFVPQPTNRPQPTSTVAPTNTPVPPTAIPASPTPLPTEPPPPPATNTIAPLRYNGSIVQVSTKCGQTQVLGVVNDAAGNPIPGVTVRLWWTLGETYHATSGGYVRPETSPSGWEFVLGGANTWYVAVVDGPGGALLSDPVTVQTSATCNPGDPNIVKVQFTRNR